MLGFDGTVHALSVLVQSGYQECSNEKDASRNCVEVDPVSCPHCHNAIVEGFYCIRCGDVPSSVNCTTTRRGVLAACRGCLGYDWLRISSP
jgi:hypothetical protein